MDSLIQTKTTTRPLLLALVLVWQMLPVITHAVFPPPDGGYPGGNTAEGQAALFSLTTGTYNTAVGFFSLRNNSTAHLSTAVGAGALLANTADENTATGAGALLSNTTGVGNTANGAFALLNNNIGIRNTATGGRALFYNTTGFDNTAIGFGALTANTTGGLNTASGSFALSNNTTGQLNTAVGAEALKNNTTGSGNTASGRAALLNNSSGAENTAAGAGALLANTTGNHNTATGYNALFHNTAGHSNTACGHFALAGNTVGEANVALGNGALQGNTIGAGNIAIGYLAGYNLTTGNNNIDIGNQGVAGESDAIRIGATQTKAYMAGVYGGMVNNQGAAVLIDPSGKLGTIIGSSRRFKQDIKPMDTASEAILALKPVSFRYKDDNTNTPQFGLIAEEVANVIPELVVRDKEGKPYSVRYDQVNAMLLNEFLKEHRKVEKQQARIAELRSTVAEQRGAFQCKLAEQQKQIEALASGLRKLSAELKLQKPPAQAVAKY
jgi:trimeric autotransporter adhesin